MNAGRRSPSTTSISGLVNALTADGGIPCRAKSVFPQKNGLPWMTGKEEKMKTDQKTKEKLKSIKRSRKRIPTKRPAVFEDKRKKEMYKKRKYEADM